jgi:PAS domain S-box-containing protein
MKIRLKLFLGFLSIVFLVMLVGYFSSNTSQKALQRSIEENTLTLAVETLDKIDRNIFNRIENFQSYSTDLIMQETLLESNQEFEGLVDLQSLINKRDKEWTSIPKDEITAFMKQIMSSKLSRELIELLAYYNNKYDYNLFGEVFVTNKYGANVAQSGKTTDYRQDDETWWQKAKRDGLSIRDVEFDESAGIYSTDIGIRIDDENGNFIGAMKVILNIVEVINIIKELKASTNLNELNTTEYTLVTKEGNIIFSTKGSKRLTENTSLISEIINANEGLNSTTVIKDDEQGDTLAVHAHSRGYKDFEGLGWIFIIEHNTENIFAPVSILKRNILVISLAAAVFAIVLSFFVSKSISKPVIKLRNATKEIGKGFLDVRIDINSRDEIGQLAVSFNQMVVDLRKYNIALSEGKTRLDRAQQIAHMGSWEWDVVTNESFCSDELYRIHGLEPQQYALTFEGFLELVHPEDREFVKKSVTIALYEGKPYSIEFRIVHPDGTIRIVQSEAKILLDKTGKSIRMIGTEQDITERVRTEEKIKNLAKFPSENPNPVLRVEKNGIILFANNASSIFLDYWGTQTGQSLPEDWHKHVLDVLRSGTNKDYEIKCNDRIFSITLAPVVEEGYANFYCRDITERKLAEEELGKIFDLSIDMICVCDINNGYFKKINPAFGKTLGYSEEEILGRPFLDFIHPDDKNSTVRATEEMLDKGVDASGFENRYRCKNGSYKWLMWTAKLNQEQGITYAVARDITEKKLVEDELKLLNETLEQRVAKRTAELAKANEELVKMQKLESVGVLAGGIAHDFNNNLQSILSCVTLAKTYANPEDEVYEKLTDAERITLQAKGLSQQLLTFSRGGDPIRKTIFISELIKESVNLALSGSNVKCEFNIPNNLWPVEADKGQLNQVISNFIINANQAMPEGGIVKVKTENINVDKNDLLLLKEGKYVRITIEDQGTGISHEHLQKIFDPYFTTKEKGNGLGLATCYSIIKKHDGYIDVESEVGIGTVFHIYLPASLIEPQKKPVLSKPNGFSPEPDEGNGKGKVLLMDDEGIIRLVITQHLRNLKYEVEAAGNGAEAIELYKKAMESGKSFDAVVMDLTIPGDMGGKEATKRLLEIDPKAKVIVASGYVDDPIMAEFRKYGFKGVLTKPYEIYELDDMLRNVIMEKN